MSEDKLTDKEYEVLRHAADIGMSLYHAGHNHGISKKKVWQFIEQERGRIAEPVVQEEFDPWLGL